MKVTLSSTWLLRFIWVAVLFIGVLGEAWAAENFTDPTRPPASIGGIEPNGVALESSGPVLQSVLIAAGRKIAVISGQNVKLGEKFGEARVVSITESEVVLKNGKDRQTLRLFPDVEKRIISKKVRAKSINQQQKPEGSK